MWITALLLGCVASEWGRLPAPPPDAPVTELRVSLLGRPVGTEHRVRVDDQLWVVRRFAFEVDGSPVSLERRSLSRFDASGALLEYQPHEGRGLQRADGLYLTDGNPIGPAPAFALWETELPLLEALGERSISAVRPRTLTFESATVAPGSWTVAGDTVHYRTEPDGPHWRSGILTLAPGDADFERTDVVGLLRVATDPIARPTRTRRLVAVVNGEQVRVERPLPAEIPLDLPIAAQPPRGPAALLEEVAGILQTTQRRRDAVTLLVRTVNERLDHQVVPGTPEALAALQSGKGDCNDAAALLVALCEAAGIPAHSITGVVYRDGVHGPGFYPHAWVEVDYGTRWVAVDPALGQIEADATHIPLGRGLDDPAVLMRLAPLTIRVVEVN